ncbi:MAG: hypothetical protein AAGG01_14620, partial [Planctomycetota bacterium]
MILATAVAFLGLASQPVEPEPAQSTAVLLCADRAGELAPCRTCPGDSGLGGASRGGTLLSQLELERPSVVVSAGNDLFEKRPADEPGRAVAALYDTIGVDVVNISYRDFRFGLQATRTLLTDAGFAAVSSNLRDDAGAPLFEPFAVWSEGDVRVAVVGVTQEPDGIAYLPHLQRQLAGIAFADPLESVRAALPAARAAADQVLLVGYGNAAFTDLLANSFNAEVDRIAVGGVSPNDVPQRADVRPVAASLPEGRGWTRAILGEASAPEILKVTPDLPLDDRVEALLGPSEQSEPVGSPFGSSSGFTLTLPEPEPAVPLTAEADLAAGAPMFVETSPAGEGRGLIVRVFRATTDADAETLSLDIEIENDIPSELAFGGEREAGERVLVALKQNLFLVQRSEEGAALSAIPALANKDLAGALPQRFQLGLVGSTARGIVSFPWPAQAKLSDREGAALALWLDHDEFAPAIADLSGDLGVAAPTPEDAPANRYARLVAASLVDERPPGADEAGPGQRWVRVAVEAVSD